MRVVLDSGTVRNVNVARAAARVTPGDAVYIYIYILMLAPLAAVPTDMYRNTPRLLHHMRVLACGAWRRRFERVPLHYPCTPASAATGRAHIIAWNVFAHRASNSSRGPSVVSA